MIKKLAMLSLVMILIVSSMTFSLSTTQAAVTIQEKTGKLGDANYIIQIPSNWNGRLVVCCRGFAHDLSQVNLRFYANSFSAMVQAGFAFAISDYGSGGYCIKDGIIRTHQLTEYVINNFHVSGKVYLIGISMGATTALMLGAKYPELYAGVLEIAGTKDITSRYYAHSYYAGIEDDLELGSAVLDKGGVNPPFPCATIADFRTFCTWSVEDVTTECGGTPDEKPKAYERISPIDSAIDIAIPTISIHGTADALAPYSQSIAFMDAVTTAGHANLYRLYKVVGGQHCDTPVMAQIAAKMPILIGWSEYGVPPPPSSY